ncbi:LysR family transcriptional regulator [Aliidongia dinghuensis]|uniref:LysR family transcriptional regulator n=1 Tax=Aliidongia dinghuensis TaxID=1867774 RepID=A0A8J3E5D3_9PROT|nr:transcriptional regulator GcvA [Aliidongia dinghuensis]GGF34506.1 LysR family transcriptional regulator [Aliidongia dinghuensis]
MDPGRLPSLNAVRSFAVAGRLLSFTAAAHELNVTQGAVSRMVQSLETELGVQLFERHGRAIGLTPAGAAYHREITEALARIAAATSDARGFERAGVLSLSALPTLAMRWLVPRLPSFQRAHPDIQVDLAAGDGPVDFATDRVDMAIRHGLPPWPAAAAARLMTEEVGVVCAPHLSGAQDVTGPADLAGRALLQHTTRRDGWRRYFGHFGVPAPDLAQAPAFEHLFMLAEAAASGMGFALMPLFLVRTELAAGRLIQPIAETVRPDTAYYILHRPGADRARKVRLFKTWLLRQAAEAVPR